MKVNYTHPDSFFIALGVVLGVFFISLLYGVLDEKLYEILGIEEVTSDVIPHKAGLNTFTLQSLYGEESEFSFTAGSNTAYLDPFCRKLAELGNSRERVRIAYFGDSMIEGDLITQTLRNELQRIFGGMGVGYVPILSPNPPFRHSIQTENPKGWTLFSIMSGEKPLHEPGLAGEVFAREPSQCCSDPGELKYLSSSLYPRTQYFERVKFLYGTSSDDGDLSGRKVLGYSTDIDQTETQHVLDGQAQVNALDIFVPKATQLNISLYIPSELPVYGLYFEGEQGVSLDNFSLRGSSGLELDKLSDSMLTAFDDLFSYDLIIFHYGLNLIKKENTNYERYVEKMKRIVARFQRHFPEANFMMVSVSDKSTLVEGELRTDPSIPYIIEAQQKIARESGIAYFDMYRAMGGYNAMIRWARSVPRRANQDLAHISRDGADLMGRYLFKYIMRNYYIYTVDAKNDSLGQSSFD